MLCLNAKELKRSFRWYGQCYSCGIWICSHLPCLLLNMYESVCLFFLLPYLNSFHVLVYSVGSHCLIYENNSNVICCSPKKLRSLDYSLPEDGVSSIIPSGWILASRHCKCYLLKIVHNIMCCHIYSWSTNINHLVASGFMKTFYRLRSFDYPMPPPLVLECKFFVFDILDATCPLLYK